MTWFRVCFPDLGAGRTKKVAWVEGDDEADVRQRAADSDEFGMYDTSSGTVVKKGDFDPHDLVSGVTTPNDAVTADGDVIRRGDA